MPSPNAIPMKLGRYEIKRQLGHGGMGQVLLGYDPVLQREAAIKVLNDDSSSAEDMQRFQREALAVAKLNHPGIVTVYEMGQEQGRLFLAMELIKGRPFSELLQTGQVPDVEELRRNLALFRQVLAAMAYAHDNGVVHRDLKPENVMVTDSGQVKILDFGLAFMAGQHSLTRTGDMGMGTPSYVAPEQINDFAHTDSRADIYSLGVVLYQLVTGSCPFVAPSTVALIYQIVYTEPAPPSQSNPLANAELDGLVLRMLRKKPQDRFQSVADLLPLFDKICADLGGGKTAVTSVSVPPAGTSSTGASAVPPAGVPSASASAVPPAVASSASASAVPPAGTSSASASAVPPAGTFSASVSAAPPAGASSAGAAAVLSAGASSAGSGLSSLGAVYAHKGVGELFEFGRYPQGANGEVKPIVWRVLRREADRLLVIAEQGLDCKRYNEVKGAVAWSNCSLRRWLNGAFLAQAFNEQERSLIMVSCVLNNAGLSTNDRIFPLSLEEAGSMLASAADRLAKPTDFAMRQGVWIDASGYCCWWLRSRGRLGDLATNINFQGDISLYSDMNNSRYAVRPAMQVAL